MISNEQFDALVNAVRAIAHGPMSGPTGLELVAMALSGEKNSDVAIGPALATLAQAVETHAEAVTTAASTIASAIEDLDNGECLRAFRDACRAFADSKAVR